MNQVNRATVQYQLGIQDTTTEAQSLPQGYKQDLKKPVDRYANKQEERYWDNLKKSRAVTYRGLVRASGRAKRKAMRSAEVVA